MLKRSFKLKIIIPTVIVFVILVVIISVFLSLRFSAINTDLISEKLIANTNSLNRFLESSRANSMAAAVSMARYPDAVKAIKERDREEILSLFSFAQELYHVNYFTITDGEGKVLARTHEPDNFGGSIINQHNIQEAIAGRVTSSFEAGTVVTISIRTGAPVYDTDGSLVGIVSAGVRLDTEETVNELRELLHSEVAVFMGDRMIVTTITRSGHSIVGTSMDPRIAEVILGDRQEYTGEADILGDKYVTYYKPLLNSRGEAVATIFTGIPVDDIIAKSNESIRDGIIIGLIGLAAAIVLLYVIVTTISKPIGILSHNMMHIANGDLSVDIYVKNEDEIGVLGKALQKIADILHKLLDEINLMISEHEKGNVDHCLNAEEFNGGYKTLVNDILSLATVSTTDSLTGIPNRRSFDSRLNMEWNRAMRDQTPLCVMMMDIDRFKLYNDTFGHQQGDLALQAIAATIKGSLKRSTDLAARWGGEEFVVLLPVTSLKNAHKVAEDLRAAVEKTIIPCVDKGAEKVTISIGLNTLVPTPDSTVKDFIAAADAALYRAKASGRNSVVVSEYRW